MRFAKLSALLAMTTLALPFSVSAQNTSLPGGATSLNESHGTWSVTCAIRQQQNETRLKICTLSQQQIARQTHQRALAIELRPEGEGAKGMLVLPFGIALENGISYQLDDGATGAMQRFRTCLPIGCMVDVDFDASTVASLRAGNVLKVLAVGDGGQETAFSISLTGFFPARPQRCAADR